jgi:hypothetical protein
MTTISESSALNALPTAFIFITGTCIEFPVNKAESVISFESKTVPVLAVLRKIY